MVGIACRTSNAPEAASQDIPRLWGKFASENIYNKISHKAGDEIIALYCDYEGDYTQAYTVIIGCRVHSADKLPIGLLAKILPPGSYGLFEALGDHPQALIKTWENIWNQKDLPRTYTGDYELYKDPDNPNPQRVEVFIALKS